MPKNSEKVTEMDLNAVEPEKKVTPAITEAQLDTMAAAAGQQIKATQDLIRLKIPFDKLNPKDAVVPVCINGYVWQIKRGETVEVPQVVSDVLTEAGYI